MSRLFCLFLFLLFGLTRSACCEIIVDAFDSDTFLLTQEDIQQSGIAGFGLIQSAPEVLGEERGISMGSFSPAILTDPMADVRLAVESGRMTVSSNYFVEGARLQYGNAEYHLNLDLTDEENSVFVVGFDYFNNFGDPDNPGMSLRVGAADVDGNLKQSSDPFFYAFATLDLTPSDSPFELKIPVANLTNQDPEIDLSMAATLIFDTYPQATDFAYAINGIRLVPEPNLALWLLAIPLVLRHRRAYAPR